MKPFLPIALAFALGLAASAPLIVQAAPGKRLAQGGKRHGERMQKLAASLGLTEAQKARFKPLLQSTREQAKAIKTDATLTPEAKQDKLKELRQGTKQQMLSVLTPDQRGKLKTLRQQRRAAKVGKA